MTINNYYLRSVVEKFAYLVCELTTDTSFSKLLDELHVICFIEGLAEIQHTGIHFFSIIQHRRDQGGELNQSLNQWCLSLTAAL